MLALAWYCPSEGDGTVLGSAVPERPPELDYLRRVVRAAEAAGAAEILIPTGAINDSFAPDSRFAESWTTASALAASTERIRLIVAVNAGPIERELAAHQAETLESVAPGRIAINLVAGGGPDDPYGGPSRDHAARYARLGRLADALRRRFDGPLYVAGSSDDAVALARRVASAYLMWGEPPDTIAGRIAGVQSEAGRPMRFGLRIHIIARSSDAEAVGAARGLVASAAREHRSAEYAAFDSVGQASMNALQTDEEDWVEPGLWAGIRAVRGGAGTALVGSYDRVIEMLHRYQRAGVDFVIASGYPHLEEVGRVGREIWKRLSGERAG